MGIPAWLGWPWRMLRVDGRAPRGSPWVPSRPLNWAWGGCGESVHKSSRVDRASVSVSSRGDLERLSESLPPRGVQASSHGRGSHVEA